MKLYYVLLLFVWTWIVNATACLENDTESACMNSSNTGCFFLLHENRCVRVPSACSGRMGMTMCQRANPKHCRWNQTSQQCYDFEWNICPSSVPGCPSSCSFNWDVAECVLSAQSDSEMAHHYWCGLDEDHPLQWGLVNESLCQNEKGVHCTFSTAYRLCTPKHVARMQVQHFYDRGGEERGDDDQDVGYGLFDAVIVIVSFCVLFCVFVLCLDASMYADSPLHEAYHQHFREMS